MAISGNVLGTYAVTYTKCDNEVIQDSDIAMLCLISLTVCTICYIEGNFNGAGLPTNVGSSTLRNNTSNNWLKVRDGAWIALESKKIVYNETFNNYRNYCYTSS